MNQFHLYILLGFVLLFASCVPPTLQNEEELKLELSEVFQNSKSVGAAVLITNSDSVIFQQYLGYADKEAGRKVDSNSLFGIGSISKTFTALAIFKLIEAGKFELNNKLEDLLPELDFRNKWRSTHALRLVHILEHTSGFDELHLKDQFYPVKDDDFPLEEAVKLVQNSLKPRWKPGTRFAYSNVNYLLAGYLIEKYADEGFDEFLQKEVLMNMGMENTTGRSDEINQEHIAKSYLSQESALPFRYIIARPAGAVFSSATEMGMMMRALLTEPDTFLTEESYEELKRHHSIAAFAGTENGYRSGLRPSFRKGSLYLGHGGAYNKYRATFYFNQKLDVGIFLVSNGPNSGRCLAGMEKVVFDHILSFSSKPVVDSLEALDLDRFTGYYRFASPRVQFTYPFSEYFTEGVFVKIKEGKLFMSGLGKPERQLFPRGDGRFSFSSDTQGFEWVFPKDQKEVLYSSLGFYYEKSFYVLTLILALTLSVSLLLICLSQGIILIKTFLRFRKRILISRSEFFLAASATTFLTGLFSFFFLSTMENMHEPQFFSIVLFLATCIFPLLAAGGVISWAKQRKTFTRLNNIYLGLIGFSLLFYGLYLGYWGYLGLKMWEY